MEISGCATSCKYREGIAEVIGVTASVAGSVATGHGMIPVAWKWAGSFSRAAGRRVEAASSASWRNSERGRQARESRRPDQGVAPFASVSASQ